MSRTLIACAAAIVIASATASCTSTPVPASTPSPTASSATSPPPTSSLPPTSSPSPPPASTHGELFAVHDPGHVTGTITGTCVFRDNGQLPDPRCTPGSVDPAVTQANIHSTICKAGYTRTVRPPVYQTSRFKYEIAFPAYGIANIPGSGTIGELDHLVPLELGGSNDATNLWPELGPVPNAKDKVENYLNGLVCAGKMKLATAQRKIAANWEGVNVPSPAPTHTASPVSLPTLTHTTTPAPAHASCYPVTSGGNCYRAGEFCRSSDHGTYGIAENGARIHCVSSGSRYRWVTA